MEASDVTQGQDPYDPSAHSVEEILAYLGENPDQVEAVKAAEAAGQNRATVAKFGEASAQSGGVTLRTAYPIDRFEHGVKGADPITAQGTAVPKGKVKQIQDAAEANGVRLEGTDA